MATFYVSPTGRSSGAGNVASPMSFSRALDVAGAGDEILLLDGQYPKLQITKPVIVRAVNRHVPKVRGSADYGVQILASGVTVDGLDVQAGSNKDWPPHGIVAERGVHHVTILNNRVHDCPGSGISCAYDDYYHIEGNECFNNAAGGWLSGISIYQPKARPADAAWIAEKGARIVVRGNVSHDNLTKAGAHTDGNGIIIDDFRNTQNGSTAGAYQPRTLVEGNLVYGNGGKGIQVTWSDNVTVRGNTAIDNNHDLDVEGTDQLANLSSQDSHNCIWEANLAVANPNANRRSVAIGYNYGSSKGQWIGNATFNGTPGEPSVMKHDAGDAGTWTDNLLGVDPKLVDYVPTNPALAGIGWRPAGATPDPVEPEEPQEPVEPDPVEPTETEAAALRREMAALEKRVVDLSGVIVANASQADARIAKLEAEAARLDGRLDRIAGAAGD